MHATMDIPLRRDKIFDKLSPRGVCSRIPHSGAYPPQHVSFLVHVYGHIITYLVSCEWRSGGVDYSLSTHYTRQAGNQANS